MTTVGTAGDVYRLVFELTARATDVPYDSFVKELVAGLAAHYHAEVCRIHLGGSGRAAATADVNGRVGELAPDEKARFDAIDAMLAEEVRRDGVLRSALDLDGGEEIVNFLARALRSPESFAFPLIARGKAFGAVCLYLPDSYPFAEADVRGLQAIGNVIFAATNHQAVPAPTPAGAPLPPTKVRTYHETLDRVNKVLDELHFLTDARAVLLLDGQGGVVAKRGEESRVSTTGFASVVASGFAASRRLAGIYGALDARSVLHEGDRDSVFVIEVTENALLCVVYRDHGAPALITRWAQSAAGRLAEQYHALLEARRL